MRHFDRIIVSVLLLANLWLSYHAMNQAFFNGQRSMSLNISRSIEEIANTDSSLIINEKTYFVVLGESIQPEPAMEEQE